MHVKNAQFFSKISALRNLQFGQIHIVSLIDYKYIVSLIDYNRKFVTAEKIDQEHSVGIRNSESTQSHSTSLVIN